MHTQRSQGRPCRGGNEVGKTRIVESLREMLRAFPGEQVSRKHLAEFAGITPALITYYFPSKEGLISEAALPVMQAHAEQLHVILESDDDSIDVLNRAVRYLLKCYSRDAGIIWVYRALLKSNQTSMPDYLALMSSDLERFMKEHRFQSDIWPNRALLLQGALWGIVQFVAEAKMLDLLTQELDCDRGVAPIIDVFVAALQPPTAIACHGS